MGHSAVSRVFLACRLALPTLEGWAMLSAFRSPSVYLRICFIWSSIMLLVAWVSICWAVGIRSCRYGDHIRRVQWCSRSKAKFRRKIKVFLKKKKKKKKKKFSQKKKKKKKKKK